MRSSTVSVKISVVALIAIGVVIRDVDAKRYRRIIGGQDAGANEFPWMARLNMTAENGRNYDCGGAIISSRHILTSASCLIRSNVSSIWTGTNIRNYSAAIESHPAKIIQYLKSNFYSRFNSEYSENDIGIVVLDKDLQLDENQNVTLLTDKETAVGTRAVLPGWGFTDESGQQAMVLQKTTIFIRRSSECSAITAKQLCGQSIPTAAPYCDDSGSPLMVDGRIVGILTSGEGIPGRMSIYTDVYHYREWIKSTIGENV